MFCVGFSQVVAAALHPKKYNQSKGPYANRKCSRQGGLNEPTKLCLTKSPTNEIRK